MKASFVVEAEPFTLQTGGSISMGSDGSGQMDAHQLEEKMTQTAQKLWQKAIEQINLVLEAHKYYGFTHFQYSDPSIEVILGQMQMVELVLSLLKQSEQFTNDPERMIVLLNCEMSVTQIKVINTALKTGNEEAYRDCIQKLSTQRQY
ncbi:hypothetical protein L2Y96_17915 [Luteibacter aegosomaticola]|uniref:hypothetical protein n=1 Tax=Luteibacter aegosomaticola TaxID=2911538 RepID=UPI001FF91297|nr:hypothetical protein [Luteibacter aegosomaticola]UPG89255.1 hypothetical protein L2Y96_17915 [Luteibacter aegosomaticola]